MIYNCGSYYGNFRTRTFSQIFSEDGETFDPSLFKTEFKNSGLYKAATTNLKATLEDENLVLLGYLLFSRYGNSHISNSDEIQFKYKVFATIFQYGPTWQEKLNIQEKLRNLTQDEIERGSKTIYNHAYNDAGTPSTDSLDETPFINDQNTSKVKKSKIDSNMDLWDALATDVTSGFLDKFKKLFISVAVPDSPLWYETDVEED